jgi:hypothetical protein
MQRTLEKSANINPKINKLNTYSQSKYGNLDHLNRGDSRTFIPLLQVLPPLDTESRETNNAQRREASY